MNAYESGEQKNVPAVLVYCRHGGRVLMIHRNSESRPGDYHAGKWNGLGGKCERNESYLETARRELREESGLDLREGRFRALGLIQFPDFKAHKNEDWTVMVFTADVEDADLAGLLVRGEEGELHWVPETELARLNLWPGDREFIPYVVERRPFHGAIWYRGSEVLRSRIEPWSTG